ncbi:conserved hypothetical protein [Frankia sp. AiPs1]|uniref:hypothetical protein n=1 Tax=Frankia sp. AiPa1 TaxID=573492 RepID=UPI00202B42F1|nr:hypothetical protein [Frankia sp. AiPa1]MCL9758940.1 hypothetical protein [Frankia sp. AiPa1]
MYDILADRERALAIVRRRGLDHFLTLLDRLASIYHGCDCDIYKFSLEWTDKPCALKARGIRGDLLIIWR